MQTTAERYLTSQIDHSWGLLVRDRVNAGAYHLAAAGNAGNWVTINGVHVLIKNGVVVKGPKRLLGKTHAEAKAHKQSDKAKIASANANPTKKEVQRYSEEHNEPVLAKALDGRGQHAVSLRDNEPVDVITTEDGKITHGTELKTLTSNKAGKITMSKDAIAKKKAWELANKAEIHTVVFDDRKVYNANGEGLHGPASARNIYYKRGGGSFRLSTMHPVKNMDELRTLIATPNARLPAAAQRLANWKS